MELQHVNMNVVKDMIGKTVRTYDVTNYGITIYFTDDTFIVVTVSHIEPDTILIA